MFRFEKHKILIWILLPLIRIESCEGLSQKQYHKCYDIDVVYSSSFCCMMELPCCACDFAYVSQYDNMMREMEEEAGKKKWIKCNMKYSSEHCDKVIHPCHAENMLDLTWNGFKNDVPNRMKRKLADISTTILLFFIFKYACFNRVRIAFSAAMKSNCERFYDCVAIKMGTIYAPQKGKEWERERESEAHLPLFGMGDWVDGFGWLEWSINTREWWAQAMNMCC